MEYTEKLGFPIPEVTRGGDVNDVIDITETIQSILEYIDSGSGDYLTAVAYSGIGSPTVPSQTLVTYDEILDGGSMLYPSAPAEEEATPGYPQKIGWSGTGESDYAKINTDGTILIKKAGNYNIIPQLFWTTSDTDGDVVVNLHRSDIQDDINSAYAFIGIRTDNW